MAAEIDGDSPQAVAYALLERIAVAENWGPGGSDAKWAKSRREILDTYKECLNAVLGEYLRWGSFPT